jgi:GTPase Era involved in 16S rRNA processing
LGERAAGKSTLCNSIFGQAVFKSGLSLSTNMTAVKQERIHVGKLYIDTPGFAEGSISDQVAKEIEEALKYNNNYKIVFVVKSVGLDLGRSKIDGINKICNAIQTNFEYGIVFNQISRQRIKKMNQQGVDQEKLKESSCMPIKPIKLPSSKGSY